MNHVLQRAQERYQVTLTLLDLKSMVDRIRSGRKCAYLAPGINGAEVWTVFYKQITYRLVYNPENRRILTFLRPEISAASPYMKKIQRAP